MRSPTLFTAILGLCAALLWSEQRLGAQPYGLASRPSFADYQSGTLPTTAPTFSGSWSTVPACPNLTFLNALGITPVVEGRPIRFTVREARPVVLEVDGRHQALARPFLQGRRVLE